MRCLPLLLLLSSISFVDTPVIAKPGVAYNQYRYINDGGMEKRPTVDIIREKLLAASGIYLDKSSNMEIVQTIFYAFSETPNNPQVAAIQSQLLSNYQAALEQQQLDYANRKQRIKWQQLTRDIIAPGITAMHPTSSDAMNRLQNNINEDINATNKLRPDPDNLSLQLRRLELATRNTSSMSAVFVHTEIRNNDDGTSIWQKRDLRLVPIAQARDTADSLLSLHLEKLIADIRSSINSN